MSNQVKFVFLYGISGLLIWFFILPMYNGMGNNMLALKPLTEKLDAQNKSKELEEQANNLSANGFTLNKQFQEFKPDDRSKIAAAIPNGLDVPRLLNDITEAAKAQNFDVTITTDVVGRGDSGANMYSSTNVQMQFTEFTYDDVYNFLKFIQSNMRILNIKSLSFSLGQNNKFSGSLTCETYYFKMDGGKPSYAVASIDKSQEGANDTLENVINGATFREVDALASITKSIGNKIQVHPLLRELTDTTIKVERQKVVQRTNPFLVKFD